MRKIILVLAVIFWGYAHAQKTYIHCGKIIDGVSNIVLTGKTIIVEGNKMAAIQDGFATPGAADQLIDLTTKTVLPGLMDMHVHLETQTKKNALADKLSTESHDIAFQSVNYAYVTLLAGLLQ